MQDTYKELFSKMKIAGNLAARTLDMITDFIKPGIFPCKPSRSIPGSNC